MMGIRSRTSKVAVLVASLVFAAGCSEDDGFNPPPAPESLAIVSGNPQNGTTGFPLAQNLEVRVMSDEDRPLAGVTVTWSASGGTLSQPTSVTNADGIAINSWTLGSAAGAQTVTASAPGTNTVTFNATASAPVGVLLARTAGNAQLGVPGDPLAQAVRVRAIDSNGLPLVGATVTWTVLTGGGSVNPTTSVTNAFGEASTVWRLGPAGPQTLRASVPGGASVTFTATSDECGRVRSFADLLAGGRGLETTDCRLTAGPRTGSFLEYFTFAPTTATATSFTMSSTAVDPYLVLLRGADTVAFNDNVTAGTTDAKLNLFLAPGTYRLGATTATADQTGAYTFTQTAVPAVTNCEAGGRFYVTPGVTLNQDLSATDCPAAAVSGTGATAYHDRYRIYLRAGQNITITYASAATVDPVIVVIPPTGAAVVQDNFIIGVTETLSFTAAVTGFHVLDARTYRDVADEFGTYTLTISAATPP